MPEPDEQTAEWQRRLDTGFPRGAIMAWAGEGTPEALYPVSRILVLRVVNGLPVVVMPVHSGSHKVLGPWQVMAYDRSGPRTGHAGTRVTFAETHRVMTWNPRVPDRLARQMAHDRQAFIRLAPNGGPAVQHDPDEPMEEAS